MISKGWCSGALVARQSGFTYVMILLIIAVLIICTTVTNRVTSRIVQKDREMELVQRGYYFYRAIKSYYNSSALKKYPGSLDELVSDTRFPFKVHIRKIYSDPFSQQVTDSKEQWNLITNELGEIVGISSKSDKMPLKRSNIPKFISISGDGGKYSDWKFIYTPDPKVIDEAGYISR